MNPPNKNAHLLLVDDDPVMRGMASRTLRHAGFEVTQADCGEEGLRLFDTDSFDLVLLDVMMPGIDGFEVCTRLRAKPLGALLPILMLTGLNDTDSIESAFRCGATDFVTKPINWALLGHRVRYSLRASAAAESALRANNHLANAQRLANMGSWEWLPDSAEVACSQELLRILGGDTMQARTLTAQALLAHVCETDRDKVHRARAAAASEGRPYQLEFSIQRSDGQLRTVFEQAGAELDTVGRIVKVAAIAQDITDRVEAAQRIHQLAFYDDLTGLANRQFFNEMTASAIERARRLKSLCAVVHLDLDRFKIVNDAWGHDGGDTLLRAMSKRLQACVRRADLVAVSRGGTASDLLARVGGNAFTVLLVDIADNERAALVAARLLQAIAQPLAIGDREVVVTASAGIALFPRDADDVQGLTHKAEQAMYAAKAAGRAEHRFFDEEMNVAAGAKLALENDLRRAIAAGELRLYLQPKVNAGSGAIVGAEALVRWQHPQRGLVPPLEFIPLAEESGLIVPLGEWVAQTACEALQRWGQAGLATVPLSINLSSPSFMQDDLVERLDAMVLRSGLQTRQLTLEITESMLMKDIDRTVARLHALRDRGYGLSLDDFGTGYSSLSYLKMFPIDELKIDRSFVRDVTKGGRDAAIVGSIIALGQQFGFRVVAEGVETEAQAAFLLGSGCAIQQGFLHARPMPAEEFEAFLVRRAPLCPMATAQG